MPTANNSSDKYFSGCLLTRKNVEEVLRDYGFSEVADIFTFLDFICRAGPGPGVGLGVSELAYIRKKIDICLRKNDDGDNYFIPLREFATELDCLSEIKFTCN